MRFAVDTGGTFTDLLVEDNAGLHMYKTPTTPEDPVEGVLSAFGLAAADRGMEARALLARGDLLIHGTTIATNAVLTGRTAKTAFLTTYGHPDILVFREAGRMGLPMFDYSVPNPEPYVPRALTLAQVAPQMAIVALLGLLTIVALRRAPAAGFLGAWFFVTLAPSSSVMPIHTEVGAERRMYLASMAIVVLVVVAVHRWAGRTFSPSALSPRSGRVLLATTLAVVGALAATTIARNAEYASPLTMWRTVVDRWPNGRARWALATQLKAAGRADEVLPKLREAVADYPEAHLGVGEELFAQKQYAEAVDELDAFIHLRPNHVNVIDAHEFAGRALAAQGKVDEAIGRFRLILKMVPTYAAAHGRLADLYFQHQRYAEAAEEYAVFLAARRGEAGPWTNYAISLVETGRGDQAVKAFERAVALEPRSGNARRNLAKAYYAQRDLAGAEREAREALRIDARDSEARNILAVVLNDSRQGTQRPQNPR